MATKKDIQYHNKEEVVSTYDFRITRSYRFEHKYLTLHKWISEMNKRSFKTVLDFGCGTGNVSFRSARSGLQAFSMDTSLGMLKNVKNRLRSLGVICVNGDGEKLPFKEGSFDAVVCMGVLHHVKRKKEAISEMIRVIKPGGKIYIAEPFKRKSKFMVFYNMIL